MSYIKDYIEGDYEITQYSGGGSVREIATGKIVASYVNYWTSDGSTHKRTQIELDAIERKTGLKINPKQ